MSVHQYIFHVDTGQLASVYVRSGGQRRGSITNFYDAPSGEHVAVTVKEGEDAEEEILRFFSARVVKH